VMEWHHILPKHLWALAGFTEEQAVAMGRDDGANYLLWVALSPLCPAPRNPSCNFAGGAGRAFASAAPTAPRLARAVRRTATF
jgi:hypothetical protein